MVYAKTRNEKEWKKHITALICVFIASIIMSINIKSFVRAGDLIPGGFTGLSLLIQRSANLFAGIELPYSIINISLNALPAFIGFNMIGKKFTSYSVLMIVLNSFLVDLIPVTPITYDPLLVSVFGGILNGIAIVIALYGKASSGGTDFIAAGRGLMTDTIRSDLKNLQGFEFVETDGIHVEGPRLPLLSGIVNRQIKKLLE